ncbi:MAG: glycosyltransferase family 39 protein [Acidobacteriota bacterium]
MNVLGILPWARIKFPVVDLADMVYGVRRLQLGYVPYRDTFTHHFLGYILPFYALGSIVSLTPLVLKIAGVCFNFATAVLLWLLLRDVADRRTAWLGAFLTVTVGWFWSWQGAAFNVQSCLAPLVAAELLLVVRACLWQRPAWLYAASCLAGVLLTFDQRAAAFALPGIASWFLVRHFRRWTTTSLAILLFLLAPGVCLGLLWWAGAWRDFVDQTLVFPLFYRNQGVPVDVGQFLSAWFGTWLGAERIVIPIFILGLGIALLRERRRAITTTWLTACAAAALAVAIGGRPYPNYFISLAPITIVVVSLIPWYLRPWSDAASGAARVALVSLGLFCALRPMVLLAVTGSVTLAGSEQTLDAASAYLRNETTPNDGVLVWGYAPQIYVMSDRFRTFRDAGLLSVGGGNFASMSGDGRLPHMVHEFDRYLAETPPKVIVVYTMTTGACAGMTPILHNLDYEHAAYLQGFRDFIARSYHSALIVRGKCDRAELLVRQSFGVR